MGYGVISQGHQSMIQNGIYRNIVDSTHLWGPFYHNVFICITFPYWNSAFNCCQLSCSYKFYVYLISWTLRLFASIVDISSAIYISLVFFNHVLHWITMVLFALSSSWLENIGTMCWKNSVNCWRVINSLIQWNWWMDFRWRRWKKLQELKKKRRKRS